VTGRHFISLFLSLKRFQVHVLGNLTQQICLSQHIQLGLNRNPDAMNLDEIIGNAGVSPLA
jgi:hypothetical protein